MKSSRILVTGAAGEIAHSLLGRLSEPVVALDIRKPEHPLPSGAEFVQGSITDKQFLESLSQKYSFSTIFHLAALLSSGSEDNPLHAHDVNVNGSLNMLQLAREQSEAENRAVKFILASTVAVYGIREPNNKLDAGKVSEDQFLDPVSIYGINKLYVENLGRYFSERIRSSNQSRLDFRAVRFPGILSSDTVPTSGTSDYGPLMLHAAAKGESYGCFVPEDAVLNFMVMPDAVSALLALSQAKSSALSRRVYNATSFSLTAEEIRAEVLKAFPEAHIYFEPVEWRTKLIQTWPMDTDDSAARADWGWKPEFDRERAFHEYLVPGVRRKYSKENGV